MKKIIVLFSLLVMSSFLLFGCESPSEISIEFTVTFDSNGGTQVNSITEDLNASIEKPSDPTRSGYTFDGWYTSSALSTAVTWPYTLTADVTFYAKWTENVVTNTFTVTFDSNGGTAVSAITNNENSSILKPSDPTKSGFTFDGWYTSSALTTAVTWPHTLISNVTFYAKWTAIVVNSYSVTFESNGGTAVNVITDNQNAIIAKPTDPTRTGFTFDGWYTSSALTTAVTWPHTLISNVTFYAKWTAIVVTYTITWQVNGQVVETDLNVIEGTTPTFNGSVPVKASTAQYTYTFNGWSPAIQPAQANTTYEAVFTQTIRQYTIQFNSNGGSSVQPNTSNYGTMLNEPAEPTREGYHFVSWCLDSDLTQAVTWPLQVTQNQTLYAKWNEAVPYGAYLSTMLSSYAQSPYAYIPDSMKPGANLITQQQSVLDFTSFVNVSSIPYGGHGEQWKMVVTNLEQSKTFFNVLTVVDTLSSASILAFNNYLDSNPANTEYYEFTQGIYQVTIEFKDGVMYYVLDYTATLPVLGLQTVQIALTYNVLTQEKTGRIQLGAANALKYEVTNNSYKFGIMYLGIRRAYFEISKDNDDNVEGRIFEYLGVDGTFTTGTAAEFFINDDYVSVVGNKSSSMMGWAGTIVELYSVDTGEMLGYEVRETFSSITYNTLWFNLDDTSGITTIKGVTAPLENNNPHLIYVNGSATVFATKNVGGFSTKTLSRRYDIEFRKQYFYYQSGGEIVEVMVNVPMLFVQQEQLGALVTDINSMNAGLNFTFNVPTTTTSKITSDYATLIDPFNTQKNEYTTQLIIDYIGTLYTHSS